MNHPLCFAIRFAAAFAVIGTVSSIFASEVDGVSRFDAEEPDFIPILTAHPFLMQEGGAMFLRLPGGTNILFAVGQTDMRNTSKPAQEAIRRRRVAEAKARKAIAESLHSIRVSTFLQLTEKTVVRRNGEVEESVEDLEELLEKSESEISGWIPGLPVVGTWILENDGIFCLAVGRIFQPEKESAASNSSHVDNPSDAPSS